ncbi:MAG: ABC transporter ATP-binding protein [Candidatus Verstraetearchaeota archaeon]|jgi:branched-chain amino acid transport system ATP-binding protein|nr:ABC transporter ATP-binding protein [Candidatus Verstraetearchaeota archaeon]
MLEVEKVNAGYGDLQVLWDVTMKVSKGEIVTVIGSNGAGKTTLLRTISGIIYPKSGRIIFCDKDVTRLKPHKRAAMGIGHVMEGKRLFPHLTVEENLKMGAYLPHAWIKREETLQIVYELFPILKERRKQIAGTLSGGEQQMLAIARTLMLRPKLLLLDEPSLGVAPRVTLQIFDTIKKINELEGIAILLVEQNTHLALQISTRAYVIENGRLVLEGPSEEIMNNAYVKKAYLGM